jgi:thioredoxin reductase (NADPH)
MTQTSSVYPVIVVGGGPVGIAAAAELEKRNIQSLIIEKGAVTESIRRYPKRMKFFSSAENIEIAGLPFATSNVKADRNEALQYYRKVAAYFKLHFALHTEVIRIEKANNCFQIFTKSGITYLAQKVVVATGYFTKPRLLGIPGEDLPHVSHYYDEPYAHSFGKVVIIGAGNSGVEAALELYRHDVDVTLVARGEDIKPTAKYWLVPDLRNRIKEGKIKLITHSRAIAIAPGFIDLQHEDGSTQKPAADAVYLLTGYLPDAAFLEKCGLKPDKESLLVAHNPETFESHVAGMYLAGTVLAGVHTEQVFIENGREHAKIIADEIQKSFSMEAATPALDARHGLEDDLIGQKSIPFTGHRKSKDA